MTRPILLLLASTALAQAQSAAPMCGSPNAYDAWSAKQRFQTLMAEPDIPPRGQYESTDEWQLRTDGVRAEARRRALGGLGPDRTIRVGGRVTPRYDADLERLWFWESDARDPTAVEFPASLALTTVVAGFHLPEPVSVRSLFGTSAAGAEPEFGWGPPSFRMSRNLARLLDPLNNPTCAFALFKVFGDSPPVVGLDRIEFVSVVRGEPTVWSWAFSDDGSSYVMMEDTTIMEEATMVDDMMMADSTSAM